MPAMATVKQMREKLQRTLERQQTILKMREDGKSLRVIADEIGLSYQRVFQIVKGAEQDRQAETG